MNARLEQLFQVGVSFVHFGQAAAVKFGAGRDQLSS
jgi:hypothetical protein